MSRRGWALTERESNPHAYLMEFLIKIPFRGCFDALGSRRFPRHRMSLRHRLLCEKGSQSAHCSRRLLNVLTNSAYGDHVGFHRLSITP